MADTPSRNSPTSQMSMYSNPSVTDIEEAEEETLCVQDVPHKGNGLVSTKSIARGELLFAERPLFTVPSSPTNSTLLIALAECSREEQQRYFALCNSYKGRLLPAQGIFESNALYLPGVEQEQEQAGVFLLASRFNSSCVPNVTKYWDPSAGVMLFRTLRDVKAGEELCLNYCDVLGTREQRREDIMEERQFQCMCEVCELDDEKSQASDSRRSRVARLFEEVAGCGNEPTLGMRKVRVSSVSSDRPHTDRSSRLRSK